MDNPLTKYTHNDLIQIYFILILIIKPCKVNLY